MKSPFNGCSLGRKLLRLAFFSDLHGARVALTIGEFLWAVSLFLPGDTFTRASYAIMRHMCPYEEVWASLWLISAVCQTYIIISGEYHTKFAVWFSGMNSVYWWITTIATLLTYPPVSASASGDVALACMATWIWARSGWIPLGVRRAPHGDPSN